MNASDINNLKPVKFYSPIALSGDRNDIQAQESITENVSVEKGFPSIFSTPRAQNGKSVARKDMNAFLHMISSLNFYFQYMGRNPWQSNMSYPRGAVVWMYDSSTGGAEYVSKTNNNTTTPGSDSWVKIGTVNGLELGTAVTDTVTKEYIEGKLGYKIAIVSGSVPSPAVENTIYFIV